MTPKVDAAALALDIEPQNINETPENKIAKLIAASIASGKLSKAASGKEPGLFSRFVSLVPTVSETTVG